MDERYLRAFLNLKAHKVAGRTLRPFCLRHRLTLEAIGSPCLPGSERPINRSDLLLALRVCSIADPQEAVQAGGLRDWLTLARWILFPASYVRALTAWVTYLEDSATHPIIGTSKKGLSNKRPNRGLDWTLAVIVGLMEVGFSEDEAWNMAEGRALHYYFAQAIRSGAELDFWTSGDDEALPRMREAVKTDIERVKALVKAGKINLPKAPGRPRARPYRPSR